MHQFIIRRLHSLTGLFLVLFLFEHLLTNSEAAFPIGHDGEGFIRMVNFIHSLPYLKVIEISLLAVPILLHAYYGIFIILQSRSNTYSRDKIETSLGYERNWAYAFQRGTSWILLIGLLLHVGQMRFYAYPDTLRINGVKSHIVQVTDDEGLMNLAQRLNIDVYKVGNGIDVLFTSTFDRDASNSIRVKAIQDYSQEGNLVIEADSMGKAILMTVRDTFKSITIALLYSLFVIAASFHAANGVWSGLISWGVLITDQSQQLFLKVIYGLMFLLMFLGLSAVWVTYGFNLYA